MARLVNLYYDVPNQRLRDSNGREVRDADAGSIYFRERPLVNLQLVQDDRLTPYTELGDSAESYVVVVDDDFDHSTTVMCKTTNSGVNQDGDWEGGDSSGDDLADASTGEFSFYLSANTSTFQTKVGANSSVPNSELEFQAWNGSNLVLLIRMPFHCRNIHDDDGDSPPALSTMTFGSVAIGNGTDSVEVTGLALTSVPSYVLLTVRKPSAGDYNFTAVVLHDTVTTDGFTAELPGSTDKAGYKLDYMLY